MTKKEFLNTIEEFNEEMINIIGSSKNITLLQKIALAGVITTEYIKAEQRHENTRLSRKRIFGDYYNELNHILEELI